MGWAERTTSRRWDAIILVASLHHLPTEETLRELRESLIPGGRLVVIGHHRQEGVIDQLTALTSVVLNRSSAVFRGDI